MQILPKYHTDSRRNVNSDGSTTLIDKATGMVVGTVRVPFGYQVFGDAAAGGFKLYLSVWCECIGV